MRVHYRTRDYAFQRALQRENARTTSLKKSRHKLEISARSIADDRLVPRFFSFRSSAFRPLSSSLPSRKHLSALSTIT